MKNHYKYLSISIYALAVVAAGTLLVMLMFAAREFFIQRQYQILLNVLQPFVFGFVLAYILNPMMVYFEEYIFNRVHRHKNDSRANAKLRRMLSVLSTFVTTIVVVTLLSVTVSPQISDSIHQLTDAITELFAPLDETGLHGDLTATNDPIFIYDELMNRQIGLYVTDAAASIQDFVSRFGLRIDIEQSARDLFLSATARVTAFFNEYFQEIFNATAGFIMNTARLLFNLLVAIIAAFYMLVGKERHIYQIKRLLYAFLPLAVSNKLVDVTRKTHQVFGGFFRGKLLESLIVGIICFICMTIFGIEYPLLISLIVGITNIIPFFGPFIGAIPSIFFLLLYDPSQALWFAIFILILQQIDGNFIGPKIIGDTMGLSPFWIIFAVLVMSGLLGPIGMFIGVPLFGVIYMLLKEFSAWLLTRKGVSPRMISPSADIPEKPHIESAGDPTTAVKLTSLVERLAQRIHKSMKPNDNDEDKK